MRRLRISIGFVTLVFGLPALAEDYSVSELRAIGTGRGLYMQNCMACHGPAVPSATAATPTVGPDLTLIAARDGRFDRLHVMSHIRFGTEQSFASAEATMPSWDRRFRIWSKDSAEGTRKLWMLTRYLEYAQRDRTR